MVRGVGEGGGGATGLADGVGADLPGARVTSAVDGHLFGYPWYPSVTSVEPFLAVEFSCIRHKTEQGAHSQETICGKYGKHAAQSQ